jgi:hypothetical protein
MLFLEILPEKKLDLYSFFFRDNTLSCPERDWLICFQASLRRKHEVLILETPQTTLPQWDPTKRWCVAEEWVWITPRALSFIKSNCDDKSMSFQALRELLLQSK